MEKNTTSDLCVRQHIEAGKETGRTGCQCEGRPWGVAEVSSHREGAERASALGFILPSRLPLLILAVA
eukprot:5294561-Pyramimonas_sp.AAC.1